MPRRLPPLRAVSYFEAVAERRSLVEAAGALGVTKGAVSQQIRALEQYLGVALFDRTGRRLDLTDAGQRYYVAAQAALEGLEAATARLARQRLRRSFRITALPAFVSLWMASRLSDFQAAHEDVDIEVLSDASLVDFSRSDAHAGIRFGSGEAAGLVTRTIAIDRLTPVCSPDYARAHGLSRPEDLAPCRLLHDTYWHDDWQRWSASCGFAPAARQAGQHFSAYSVVVDIARSGGGVAIGHMLLLRDMLDRGELVAPFAASVPAREPYTLVRPGHGEAPGFVAAFEDWLVAAFTQT